MQRPGTLQPTPSPRCALKDGARVVLCAQHPQGRKCAGSRMHGEKLQGSSNQRVGDSEEDPGNEWGWEGVQSQTLSFPFTDGERVSERGWLG